MFFCKYSKLYCFFDTSLFDIREIYNFTFAKILISKLYMEYSTVSIYNVDYSIIRRTHATCGRSNTKTNLR